MFVLLLLLQLKFDDIGFIRVGQSALTNQSSAVHNFFRPLMISNSRQITSLERFESTQWVFVCSSMTNISPSYLLNVLRGISQAKRTVIGRFGCIPTDFINPEVPFQKCHKYPILESGFAFTSDLINDFKTHTDFFEFSVGLSFSDATFIDDFRFNFLAPIVTPDLGRYSISYPASSSDLPTELAHVTGLTFPVFISPYAKAQVVLGRNATSSMGLTFATSDVVDVVCSKEDTEALEIPPLIYVKRPVVKIPCFQSVK